MTTESHVAPLGELFLQQIHELVARAIILVFALSLLWAKPANAEPSWYWESYGTDNFSGQISLRDDQGSALNYQRYSAGGHSSLFGSTSVQAPLTVVAGGTDVDFDIVYAGVQQTKKVCTSGSWKAYVTPVSACNSGSGTNIGGFRAWARSNSATTWTPYLAVWVQGYGWRAVTNSECGMVEIKQVCN